MGLEGPNKDKNKIETVQVGSFQVPKEEAKDYEVQVEKMAKAATEVMKKYCTTVERTIEDPREGEAIIGYIDGTHERLKVLLDPFEVPIMKMALGRNRLDNYILAKNGFTEEDMDALLKDKK